MNAETTQSPFPTSPETDMRSSDLGSESRTAVRRMAQKMHEAVDTLEQSIGAGSDKVMGWQQEYGDVAREQVRENPLVAVGAAFAVGFILAKLFSR